MAKRSPTRTQADDAATRTSDAAPKSRASSRARTGRDVGAEVGRGEDQTGAMADASLRDEQSANAPTADDAAETRSTSMGSEPSEEDIRLRAYHRFLERGGAHGQDQDDWIEAEKELRGRR
jgi:hypothetical protein